MFASQPARCVSTWLDTWAARKPVRKPVMQPAFEPLTEPIPSQASVRRISQKVAKLKTIQGDSWRQPLWAPGGLLVATSWGGREDDPGILWSSSSGPRIATGRENKFSNYATYIV